MTPNVKLSAFPGTISKESGNKILNSGNVVNEEKQISSLVKGMPKLSGEVAQSFDGTTLDLPPIFIKNITLGDTSKQGICSLRFSFDLPFNEDNGEIYETVPSIMNVRIIQVKNNKMFSFLNLSKELLAFSAEPSKMRSLPQILLNISKEIKLTKNASGKELENVFRDYKNINHFIFRIKDMEAIARIENSGKINMEYEVSLPLEKELEHLSYYIYAELDKNSLIESNIPLIDNLSGIKVNSEIVINNKKKTAQTYGLYLKDTDSGQKMFWNGFHHYDKSKGVWLTGKETDDEDKKRTLTREIFFNTKIRDKTVFDKISKIKKIENNKQKRKITEVVSPIQFGSFTAEGNTFLINTELLLEKHSGIYKYLNSIETKNKNIIKTVKIFRKRIKEVSGKVKDFKENEPKKYLESQQIFLDKSSTINKVTIIEKNSEIGKYCYGVEVVINDILKQDMQIVLNELEKNNNFLKKYLEQASMKDIHYDSEKNTFTQRFYKKYENEKKILKSVQAYIEAFLKVCSVSSFPNEMKQQIILHICPKYGNPEGINSFIRLYENLIASYATIIKSASSVGYFEESRYFNNLEQVIEYDKTLLDEKNIEMYRTFSSSNKISINKQTSEQNFIRISNKNNFENILQINKNSLTNWMILTNQLTNKIPYDNTEHKYRNAINILNGFEENTRKKTATQETKLPDLFYVAQKTEKQISQESLNELYLSVMRTPKDNSTGNVSELKVTEIMSNISKMNRKK